jgi:tyrosyl-tRNA synthetase
MSKSLNNYIAIDDSPKDMFGKIMSISDELMWKYYDLLSDISKKELEKLKSLVKAAQKNPRDIKLDLGIEIVSKFYSKNDAEKAKNSFLDIFQKNNSPEDIELIKTTNMPLPNLLKHIGFVSSTSEARRLIQQKALKIDDIIVESIDYALTNKTYLIKLGKKKFIKVKITSN